MAITENPITTPTSAGSNDSSVVTSVNPRKFPISPKIAGLVLVAILLIFLLVRFLILPLVSSFQKVNLTWWGLWENESIVTPLISEYEQKNPKVKITYIKQSKEDYRERLTNILAKGQGPDIFRYHNTWVPMFKDELDPLPPEVMSAGEFSQTFYPVASSDLTSGTSIVGIPLEYDGLALFINDEIFSRALKNSPATWDDLRQTAIDLCVSDAADGKCGTGGKILVGGVALGRTENVDHWPEILALLMLQNGVKMGNPVGIPAEGALTFYSIFTTIDHVWDETLPPSTVAFWSGKLAMYFGPSWRVFEIKEKNPALKFRVVPVPQIPKGEIERLNVTYASYWAEGVWSRSKSKKEAWNFLKYLSEKETLQKLYQNAAKTRLFGEPYPRVDMEVFLSSDPIVGAFVNQAKDAKSWYLASRTWDGPTGINSQINKYFEDAVNGFNSGQSATDVLEVVAKGVNQVLGNYGLVSPQTR